MRRLALGAGERGREIACAALLAGYRTILEDVSDSRLAQAAGWIANTAKVSAEALLQLVPMSKIEGAVREADLIVEAVADEMEMTIEMFTIFDKFAKPGAIFASTSASIPIEDLAAVTFCPERCIGLRFASTPAEGDALELVCTPDTSDETIAKCREFGRHLGKGVLVVRDNRLRRLAEVRGKQDALRGSGQATAAQSEVEISVKGPIPT